MGAKKKTETKRKKKGRERRGTYLHGRLGEDLWGLDNRWRRHDFSAVSLPSFPESDRVQLVLEKPPPPTSPGADESRNPHIGGASWGQASRMAIAAIAGASLVIAALGRIGLTEDGPGAEPAGNMDSPDIPLRKLKRCEAVLRR